MQSLKKISLVMPAYKSAKTIGAALESLFDQDYKNFEVIVVLDGEDGEIRRALLQWREDHKGDEFKADVPGAKKITVIKIDHSGSCAARNAGAARATGDYISFFSSDFVAEPGMLRRWIEAFEDNPDADMIYGGYRFWDVEGKPAMFSQPYDLYALTCYPYIDGGFPVKREWWEKHPWDEDFKSLNDWEWILRMCLDGMKPVFIPDFTFSAQMPQPGGLSYDSAGSWFERFGQIKKKHGIPDRPVCFCSLDYDEEARKLARATGQDVHQQPFFKPNNYKLIYMIGFNVKEASTCAVMLGPLDGKIEDVPKKVVHWMPADVRRLKDLKIIDLEHLGQSFTEFRITNYACTAEDVKFLQRYGFRVSLKYYFAWPENHVNGQEFKVWMPPEFGDVARGIPDIATTANKREATCEVLMDRPWGEIAEALMAGKQVVTNAGYPATWVIPPQNTHPELKAAIINTLRMLKPGNAGREWPHMPKEATSAKKFGKELMRLW